MRFRMNAALRPLVAALVAAATTLVPARAVAAPPGVAIRWSAPTSCPAADVVRRRVLGLAGRDVVLDADVVVTQAAGEFRAELNVRVGPSVGRRALVATSCEALAESVGLVLAMSATAEPSPPAPPPPPPAPPLPAPDAPPPLPPPPAPAVALTAAPGTPSAPRLPRVRLSALGAVDVGTLPVATVGAGLQAAVAIGRGVVIGLDGGAWLDESGFAQALPGQGARFSLLTADLVGCYALPIRTVIELSPCAVVELAHVSATGTGTGVDATTDALWLSLGLGAQARWELTRAFGLTLSLEGLVPTVSQAFRIESTRGNSTAVFSVGDLTGRLQFGPEVRF